MSTTETKRKEAEFTDAEKVELARSHHIWLNAFACIRPSDEFLQGVGRQELDILNESPMVDDFIGKTAVVYIRLNKS